ncbi:MAG: hypothetical protein K0R38_6259 [Polyangiaceae bacterium]|nr:hypothetical protein [Polyangiaceae bacterium]
MMPEAGEHSSNDEAAADGYASEWRSPTSDNSSKLDEIREELR